MIRENTLDKYDAFVIYNNPNIEINTVNTDEGCGIIKKGKQKLLSVSENENYYDYGFLEKNRETAINLISIETFKEKYL